MLWSEVAAVASRFGARRLESCVCAWLGEKALLCMPLSTALPGSCEQAARSAGSLPLEKCLAANEQWLKVSALNEPPKRAYSNQGYLQYLSNGKYSPAHPKSGVPLPKRKSQGCGIAKLPCLSIWMWYIGLGKREDVFKRHCWMHFLKRPQTCLCNQGGTMESCVGSAVRHSLAFISLLTAEKSISAWCLWQKAQESPILWLVLWVIPAQWS